MYFFIALDESQTHTKDNEHKKCLHQQEDEHSMLGEGYILTKIFSKKGSLTATKGMMSR